LTRLQPVSTVEDHPVWRPEVPATSKRLEEVPLDRLRFGLSPRIDEPDAEHVEALAGVITQLPPVIVHAHSMRVIDGVHRVLAARLRGQHTIKAYFFHGNEAEASLQAVLCNIAHGKPLTLAEREAAVSKVLQLHPEWSDRRIAAICGLSPKTVSSVRKRETLDPPHLRARVGRDGKTRSTNPIELRSRIAEALKSDPTASIRAIAARTKAAQGTVRDVRARMQRGDSILSPRLAAAQEAQGADAGLTEDQALSSQKASAEFAEWFDTHSLAGDADWKPFVEAIPVSRVYEVADAARHCADTWRRFASAVESRVRGGRDQGVG
jgi:ParB-like chromosome segregation protein Spo0J